MTDLRVGQQFDSILDLRNAVKEEALRAHVELEVGKSEKNRYTVFCGDQSCPWRLHASIVHGGPRCEIKKFTSLHTCGGIAKLCNKEASASFVAAKYMEKIRDQPDYTPKQLQADFKRETGTQITYKVAYNAIKQALRSIHGDYSEAYKKVEAYCQAIMNANPGSVAVVQQTSEGRFYRLFLAFGSCINGWKSCRPFIGLDGTFLTGRFLGHLLCATGIDATGGLYPIAFGIIDNENEDNWVWFLQSLRDTLQVPDNVTFVSDRMKGLLPAMDLVFPGVHHAFCMRHLDANLKKKCNNGEFIRFFWQAAYAKSVEGFNEAIQSMRAINNSVTDWMLASAPAQYWATAHFKGTRFGHLTSNIAEALNSWLLEARDKPIIPMLEIIRRQLTERFYKNRVEGEALWASCGEAATYTLVKDAQQHITKVTERARRYIVFPSDAFVFEVQSPERSVVVNIESKTCSCLEWQMLGLPCGHAVAAILFRRQRPELYTHPGYLLSSFCYSYAGAIYPPNFELVESNELLPPATRRPPGRPRRKRDRTEDRDREKRVYKCTRCGNGGHNERSCRNPI